MTEFKKSLIESAKVAGFMVASMAMVFWLGITILAPFFLPLHIWWVSVLYVLNIFLALMSFFTWTKLAEKLS